MIPPSRFPIETFSATFTETFTETRDVSHAPFCPRSDSGHEFAHDYVRLDGQRIHVVSAGSGHPVLLIPGWPQTWYAWRHVMQALAAHGFQAIAVDPPGTGFSDRPDTGYDTGATAATLHRVMTHWATPPTVAGHDVGMWVAYALASDHPGVVRRSLTEAVIPGRHPRCRSSRRRARTSSCGISCSTSWPTCPRR